MELRQNLRRPTARPIAWVATILLAMAIGVIGWQALPNSALVRSTTVSNSPATAPASLLDRNAERLQQTPISRDGGPGGQIGDVP